MGWLEASNILNKPPTMGIKENIEEATTSHPNITKRDGVGARIYHVIVYLRNKANTLVLLTPSANRTMA